MTYHHAFVAGALAAVVVALPVAAENQVAFDNDISSFMLSIAQSPDPESQVVSIVKDFALGTVNNRLNLLEERATGTNSNWKYLGLELGVSDDQIALEAMSVYGLYENKNWFLFNQSSLVNYNDRTTLNVGFGARHINDPETFILGANIFHDYEFGSEHRRLGLGFEALSEDLEFRVNGYRALTDEIIYKGISETAMDGYDVKFTYNLPLWYQSDVYFLATEWDGTAGYSTSNRELGFNTEILPGLTGRIALNETDNDDAKVEASLNYSIALGGERQSRSMRSVRNGNPSIRHMLYEPVERENRIMKQSVEAGVIVSGY
ncbi:inverse autotransporter beta domain-containing protein [Paradonghicola geojensis]|nr:inverse autotransporter beta domain-containing protein [Marivivens geojensis]